MFKISANKNNFSKKKKGSHFDKKKLFLIEIKSMNFKIYKL